MLHNICLNQGGGKGWMLHVYGGKQSLEIEDSQNKNRNISRLCGTLQCLMGLHCFVWVVCFFKCHITITFPLPFVIIVFEGVSFQLHSSATILCVAAVFYACKNLGVMYQ